MRVSWRGSVPSRLAGSRYIPFGKVHTKVHSSRPVVLPRATLARLSRDYHGTVTLPLPYTHKWEGQSRGSEGERLKSLSLLPGTLGPSRTVPLAFLGPQAARSARFMGTLVERAALARAGRSRSARDFTGKAAAPTGRGWFCFPRPGPGVRTCFGSGFFFAQRAAIMARWSSARWRKSVSVGRLTLGARF